MLQLRNKESDTQKQRRESSDTEDLWQHQFAMSKSLALFVLVPGVSLGTMFRVPARSICNSSTLIKTPPGATRGRLLRAHQCCRGAIAGADDEPDGVSWILMVPN